METLQGKRPQAEAEATDCGELKGLLSSWYGVEPMAIRVHANGMASIANALRAVCARKPQVHTIQMGFPYVDMLKVQEAFGNGVHFIPRYDEAAHDEVEQLLRDDAISAVFVEVPGNPLLKSPDVLRLSAARCRAGVPLVIDDTVASVRNVELLAYGDIITGQSHQICCWQCDGNGWFCLGVTPKSMGSEPD